MFPSFFIINENKKFYIGRKKYVNTIIIEEKYNEIEIDTILRSPQKKGYFVPENDPKNGFWFTLNPKEIANWLEIENSITSFYLDVLRKISKKPKVSQRKLATELGFSLGKLNYCLNALKKKGLVKIKNFKKS